MTRPENPQLRQSILDIASKLVAKEGFHAATMRKIADKAGVSATTIYYYFGDRTKLFEAIKFDIIDRLVAYLDERVDGTAPHLEQLICLLRSFIDWYRENTNLAELLFEKLPANLEVTESELGRYYRAQNFSVEIMRRAKEAGVVTSPDVALDAAVALGAIYGIAKLICENRLPVEYWGDPEPVIERTIEMVCLFVTNAHIIEIMGGDTE
ncbi:MAG: TetR/AcrR family transcriptional regulator [Deltaproteobacteria bacterium]|nr:TetR/AcrR family transcriptional regulator [Candidatus Zymogenaceae bacterium]